MECLRVTVMEMKNALITLCVDLITASLPSNGMLTVVLNLESKLLFAVFLDVLQVNKMLCSIYHSV